MPIITDFGPTAQDYRVRTWAGRVFCERTFHGRFLGLLLQIRRRARRILHACLEPGLVGGDASRLGAIFLCSDDGRLFPRSPLAPVNLAGLNGLARSVVVRLANAANCQLPPPSARGQLTGAGCSALVLVAVFLRVLSVVLPSL